MSKLIITMTLLDAEGNALGHATTDDNAKPVRVQVTGNGVVVYYNCNFQDLNVTTPIRNILVEKGESVTLTPSDEKGVFIGFGDLVNNKS